MSFTAGAIFTAFLLGTFLMLERVVNAAPIEKPGEYPLDSDTLKGRRVFRQRQDVQLQRETEAVAGSRTINALWKMGRSLDDRNDCLFFNGNSVFCRYGRLTAGFESQDGTRIVVYAAGGPFDERATMGIYVFDAKTGAKIKDISFRPGNTMFGIYVQKINTFVAVYGEPGGMVLSTYDFNGEVRWKRNLRGVLPAAGVNSRCLGVSENGKSILLATRPLRRSAEVLDEVLVFSENGDIEKRIPMPSPRIKVSLDGTTAVLWNHSTYRVLSMSNRAIILDRHNAAGENGRYWVEDISPDGRFIAITDIRGPKKRGGPNRVIGVELVDLLKRKVHADVLDEAVRADYQARFQAERGLSISGLEREIFYGPLP